MTFIVQRTDLLNGQVISFSFSDLLSVKSFVKFRIGLMIRYGFVYDYKIKLLGYEC